MNHLNCDGFRTLISEALNDRGRLGQGLGRDGIAWHRHLVDCSACRSYLAAETRLDELLAMLPEPGLPPGLAESVQAALAPVRRQRQDDAVLEGLLDCVPKPDVPPDLSQRVLAGLQRERAPAEWTLLRGRGLGLTAAAAFFAALLLGWALVFQSSEVPRETAYFRDELAGEDELIVYALENWDLLMGEEVDVYLASLDPAEAAVLELDALGDFLSGSEAEGR
ncbi:MAG: hypothetical protein CMJ89_03500 [Planctomycetes bacterium]|nr:hypothetical protein [Planctomycetota bacterium]